MSSPNFQRNQLFTSIKNQSYTALLNQ